MSLLSGEERLDLQNALLGAYVTAAELQRMVQFGLNESLDEIAGGENLTAIVFNLIRWAESKDRVEELIATASDQNNSNLQLRIFAEEILPLLQIRRESF